MCGLMMWYDDARPEVCQWKRALLHRKIDWDAYDAGPVILDTMNFEKRQLGLSSVADSDSSHRD